MPSQTTYVAGESAAMIANRSITGAAALSLRLRRREAAAQRQVQIHALHPLLGLHRISADSRARTRSCALGDEAQVGAADLELRLHDLERATVVGERLRQDPLAFARGESPPTSAALDLAEGAETDDRVVGNGQLLFRGADLDLRLEGAAPVRAARAGWRRNSTPDCRGPCSTNSSLEIALTPVVSAIDRQPRRLGFADAVERRRDAPLGGDDVGPPLEQLRRQARREPRRAAPAAAASRRRRRRIASEQELERAQSPVRCASSSWRRASR